MRPFNPRNRLISLTEVDALLRRYSPGTPGGKTLEVYRVATTHPSYCKRQTGVSGCPTGCVPLQDESYERTEFLGDAVLQLAVTAYLFERYPETNEGFMTRMRTKLVNGVMLADLGSHTTLPSFILVSNEADRRNPKVVEDVLEAFIGAVHLDLGFEAAKEWTIGLIEAHVDFAPLVAHQNNPKDVLKRLYAARMGHVPTFDPVPPSSCPSGGEAMVMIRDQDGTVVATGTGANRKDAECDAARKALRYLGS